MALKMKALTGIFLCEINQIKLFQQIIPRAEWRMKHKIPLTISFWLSDQTLDFSSDQVNQ